MLVNIVGVGKVSKAVAKSLKGKVDFGYIVSRDFEKAKTFSEEVGGIPKIYDEEFKLEGIVLFGLNDDTLIKSEELVSDKVGKILAVHFSGVHSSKVFPEYWDGCSIHPNISISDENIDFTGVIFGIEGNLEIAKQLVKLLGGRFVEIKTEDKIKYHLSAVLTSNFPYALAKLSDIIYESCGMEENIRRTLISQLLESVSKNLKTKDFKDALTGPVKRNDLETVRREKEEFLRLFKDKSITSIYDSFVKILSEFILGKKVEL